MKAIIVLPYLKSRGGASRYGWELAEFMASQGDNITVTNTQGTDPAAINLEASAGGVLISADGDIASAIKLHATAGTSQTIVIENTAGTDDAAISLTSTVGGILTSNRNTTNC